MAYAGTGVAVILFGGDMTKHHYMLIGSLAGIAAACFWWWGSESEQFAASGDHGTVIYRNTPTPANPDAF